MQLDEIIAQTCDCHIHFGHFRDGYFSVSQLISQIQSLGITRACVMPTGFYSKKEFFECLSALQSLPQERFDSFLWLSPRILRWMPVENIFKLHDFKAIKIHCVAHPDWLLFPEKLSEICSFVGEKQLPVMFHTGRETPAHIFCEYCKNFSQTTFILAHGNPIDETIQIMKVCKNVFVDTAFLPFPNISKLCENGLSDRILFGTDFPITSYFYKDKTPLLWYKDNIAKFVEIFGGKQFLLWSTRNYRRVFGKLAI